jgi:uncharacterized protein YkwD
MLRFKSTHAAARPATLLTLATALLAGCGDDPLGVDGLDPDLDPQVQAFAVLVNEHRVTVGCGALSWNTDVAAVAQAHSVDMVERDFFAHTNPDGDSPFDRMTEAGLSFSTAAENIAYGYGTPEAVLQAWLDSPGHRANIENCALTEHGVGLNQTYWTHLFRTP